MDEDVLKAQLQADGAGIDRDLSNSNPRLGKITGDEISNDELNSPIENNDQQEEKNAIDLAEVFEGFHWNISGDAADLEMRLNSELQALEAANVHAIIQSEDQANMVVENIEHALKDLVNVEKWLSHYTSLLNVGKMGNDVHQIEARNNVMQVTSMNQRILLTELEKLL
ncbi:hypothetical protein HK096_008157, partial [Nowakowskiella sp. JEL0078]